jgi:type IV pilus biogenesis protein CpaD/CtpE
MKAVVAVLVTLGVTACTRDVNVARHAVDEYRANAALRRETFAKCVDDPGTLGRSADCINAREAERLESRGSLRDQPPLGLRPGGPR